MTEEVYRKKQLLHARLQTALLVLLVIALLVGGLFAARALGSMQRTMLLTEETLRTLDMQQINAIVDDLRSITLRLQALDLSQLDDTVAALKDAANNLKDIDVNSLNDLVQSLDTVAQKLQNAVNAITGIFGR